MMQDSPSVSETGRGGWIRILVPYRLRKAWEGHWGVLQLKVTVRGVHASQEQACLSVYSCLARSLGAAQGSMTSVEAEDRVDGPADYRWHSFDYLHSL